MVVLSVIALGSCGDDEGGPIALTHATACGDLGMLFVSADEHRALIMSLTPEQTATIDGPTEFDVADTRASLLAGDNLGAAGCTDLVPGNLKIDDQVAVEAGTLTVSFDGATVDVSLEGAASKDDAIENVEFSDVFLAGAPG